MRAQETTHTGNSDTKNVSDAKDPAGDCRQVERLDDFDDLYQAGLSDDQLCGRMAAFADHFDIQTDCSEIERRVIEDLKAYLRPSKAPDSLVRRCHDCLSACEDEAVGKDAEKDTAPAVSTGTEETPASGHTAGDEAVGYDGGVEIPIQ